MKNLVLFCLLATVALADTSTVKFRKLELREITTPVTLKYSDIIRQVLLSPSQGGSTADQVIKVVETWEPIKKDIDAGKKFILLDQTAYDVLIQKINTMQWAPPETAIVPVAEFIKYVRDLKEEDFDATPKK